MSTEPVRIRPRSILLDPFFIFSALTTTAPLLRAYPDTDYIITGLTAPIFLLSWFLLISSDIYPQWLSFLEKIFLPPSQDSQPNNKISDASSSSSQLQPNTNTPKKGTKNSKNKNSKNNKIKNTNKSKAASQSSHTGNGNTAQSTKTAQLQSINFSFKESMMLRWYLVNAWIYHVLMDGTSGVYNIWPAMHAEYLKVDPRLESPWTNEGMISNLTFHLELFVQLPLCLIIYYGYHHYGSAVNRGGNVVGVVYPAWLYCMEIIVSVLHLAGSWYFVGSEMIHLVLGNGLARVNVDWKLEFTEDYVLYFWFGYVITPVIWYVVPYWMIKRAIGDLSNGCVFNAQGNRGALDGKKNK